MGEDVRRKAAEVMVSMRVADERQEGGAPGFGAILALVFEAKRGPGVDAKRVS